MSLAMRLWYRSSVSVLVHCSPAFSHWRQIIEKQRIILPHAVATVPSEDQHLVPKRLKTTTAVPEISEL